MTHTLYLVYSIVKDGYGIESVQCDQYTTPEGVIHAVAEVASNERIERIFKIEFDNTDPDFLEPRPMLIVYEQGRLHLK